MLQTIYYLGQCAAILTGKKESLLDGEQYNISQKDFMSWYLEN